MADIASWYQQYLGRAPDQAGLDYWNNTAKTSGLSDSALLNMFTGGAQGTDQAKASTVVNPYTPPSTPAAANPSVMPTTKYVGKDANGNPLTGWGLAADMQKYSGQSYSPYTDPYLNNNSALMPWLPDVQAQRDLQNTTGGAGSFLKQALPLMAGFLAGPLAWEAGLGGAAAAGGSSAAAGAGTTAAASGAGLGASLGSAAIPTVSVVGSAGAGLGGAATALGGAAAGAGLASSMGSGTPNVSNPQVDPSIPQVVVNGNTGATGSTSLANMMNPAAGTAGAMLTADQLSKPTTDTSSFGNTIPINGAQPDWNSLTPIFTPPNTAAPVSLPSDGSSATPIVTPGGIGAVSNPNPSNTTLPSLPGGLSLNDVLKGVSTITGGVTDYNMNQADKNYYKQLMDKMTGMYMPGTPEAGLMESKMRAQDAAAGRNSQYGIRADNLAAMLAQQRATIMTSPTFEKLAEASRGHYDSSLASLSNILGSAGTSGTGLNNVINSVGSSLANSSLGSSISDWFKSATAPER